VSQNIGDIRLAQSSQSHSMESMKREV